MHIIDAKGGYHMWVATEYHSLKMLHSCQVSTSAHVVHMTLNTQFNLLHMIIVILLENQLLLDSAHVLFSPSPNARIWTFCSTIGSETDEFFMDSFISSYGTHNANRYFNDNQYNKVSVSGRHTSNSLLVGIFRLKYWHKQTNKQTIKPILTNARASKSMLASLSLSLSTSSMCVCVSPSVSIQCFYVLKWKWLSNICTFLNGKAIESVMRFVRAPWTNEHF